MYEETVYYVACPRKDGKQPKFVKAVNNVFFLDEIEAEKLCAQTMRETDVSFKVFTAKVSNDI